MKNAGKNDLLLECSKLNYCQKKILQNTIKSRIAILYHILSTKYHCQPKIVIYIKKLKEKFAAWRLTV